MIRIVIVDDHAIVRQGVRFLLEQQPDMEVVGESKDGAQGVALVSSLVPDVVLLDLLMPKMDGVTAVREMKRLAPTTQVIMLTSYYKDEQIFNAIKAGALSYLLKDVKPEELVEAVRAAARDESVLHPLVANRILHEMKQRSQTPLNELTPRELEVLIRIAHGLSNHEIASELTISEPTVRTHIANILSKLHLADRTQAAIYALQKHLVPLNDPLKSVPEE
jgi:two-component system, NarL family, response regulator LiaR